MKTDFQRVLAFYEGRAESELERAAQPGAWFEMQRTLGVIERHVPGARDVLDLGAGSGRYAIELARRGHRVVAADLSTTLLEHAGKQAREQGGDVQFDVVNAVDLSRYEDESFDCVLAFGPLYHLVGQDERRRVVQEVARVLRPDGVVVAMYIPKLSGLNGFVWRAAARPESLDVETLRRTHDTGAYVSPSDEDQQVMQFLTVDEVVALFEDAGFSTREVVSLRSFVRGFDQHMKTIASDAPDLYEELLRMVEETCRDPAVLSLGGHALYVGSVPSAT